MKTLLILSFYFPPHYGVKVIRTTKFCKLLPKYGWRPWVLTIDPRYYKNKIMEQAQYIKELKQTAISRAPYIQFPGNFVCVKLFYSILAAIFAIRHKKKIDAVYISGSPFYPFPLTVLLTGVFKIPSVLDFRDSWSINDGYDGQKRNGFKKVLRKIFYGNIERFAVRYASRVVFATSVLQEEYTAIIPGHRHKYLTIPNGIDLDDFADIKPVRISPNKTIIMTGKFAIYTPDAMFEFLKCLKIFPELHFLYIGEEEQIIFDAAKSVGVQQQVTVIPFQPYEKTLQFIAGSEAALLSNGLVNGMGTKIFDYLALHKPIMCLVPKNSVISQKFGKYDSVVISEAPHTYEKIKQCMEKVLAIEDVTPIPIDSFTRQEATRKLSAVLRSISEGYAE